MVLGKLPVPEWSGGAMVFGKLPVPEQGPIALAVGAVGGCLDAFRSPGRSPGRAILLPLNLFLIYVHILSPVTDNCLS